MNIKEMDLDDLDNLDPDEFEDEMDTPEARGDVVDPNEPSEEETVAEDTSEEETEDEAEDGAETEDESEEEDEPEEETEAEAEEETEDEAEEEEQPQNKRWIPKERFDEINDKRKQAEQRLAALEKQAEAEGQTGQRVDRIGEIQKELTTLDKQINDAILEADADKLGNLRERERALNKEALDFQLEAVTTRAVTETRYDAYLDKIEAEYPEYNPEHAEFNDELVTETLELQRAFMAQGVPKIDALNRAIRYARPQYIQDEPAEKPTLRGKTPVRDTATKKARNQKVAKAQPKASPSRSSNLESSEDIDVYNLNDPDDLDKIPAKELARLSGDYV